MTGSRGFLGERQWRASTKHAVAVCLVLIVSCASDHQVAKSWRYDLDAACEAVCDKHVECSEQPSSPCQTSDCEGCHQQCVDETLTVIDFDSEFCQAMFEATVECYRESTCATYNQDSGGPASCDRMRRASRACIDEEAYDPEVGGSASVSGATSAVSVVTATSSGTTTSGGSVSGVSGGVGTVGGVAGAGGIGGAGGQGEVSGGTGGTSTNSDPLIIDDFEDGDDLLDPNYTGSWYVTIDPAATGVINVSELAEPLPEPLEPPRPDSGFGLHLFGQWDGSGVVLGFDFRPDGGPIDGTFFSGFSFWAKGSTGRMRVVVTMDSAEGATYTYALDRAVAESWGEIDILWEELNPVGNADMPPTPARLLGIQFDFGTAPFDVWIDDVRFLE